MSQEVPLPPIDTPIIQDGYVAPAWYRFFETLRLRTGGDTDAIHETGGSVSDASAQAAQALATANQALQTTQTFQVALDNKTDDVDYVAGQAAQDLLIAGKVDKTIQVMAGVGLSGGGALSADVTVDLEDTTVTPGTYGDASHVPQLTVDAQGRVTLVEDVSISGGGGGGGGAWFLAQTWTYSTPVASVPFIDLGGANDILVIARGLTMSSSGQAVTRVSTDNGVSYYSSSTDYVSIVSTGVEAASSGQPLWDTSATAARSGVLLIPAANTTGPRVLKSQNIVSALAGESVRLFVGDLVNPIDAIVIAATAGNFTGGTISVYTRI